MLTPDIRETTVAWQVDGVDVNASLTRPQGDGPFPAVLLVAGSGPTDRNWNTPLLAGTNGSAALLAQALTESGYVTLRYDKRASGPHLQENAARLAGTFSLRSHLEELAGGMRLLAGHADVDAGRIFILGNSEGCIHALNYQTQDSGLPAAGLILTAPPARPVDVVVRGQIAAQLAPVPGGEQFLAVYDAAMAEFAAGRPVQADASLPETMRMLILAVTSPVNLPFARELWVTDPATLLVRVTAPVLVVIGKKDLQVSWQDDGAVVEQVARVHPSITIAYPENANHVLKFESRERGELSAAEVAAGYNAEGGQLDGEALEVILAWLRAQSRSCAGGRLR